MTPVATRTAQVNGNRCPESAAAAAPSPPPPLPYADAAAWRRFSRT